MGRFPFPPPSIERSEMSDVSLDDQLRLWLEGISVHSRPTKLCPKGECCPDFSCCIPALLADKKTRQKYCDAEKKGNDATINRLLFDFLKKMLEHNGVEVSSYDDFRPDRIDS